MGVFTDIVNDSLRAELSPDGFFLMGRSRWVSDTNGPIRRIFEFKLLKGATYSARWGFSLDFVPVLRNGRLQQKPTSKSAEFDLCIDPIDECGVPPDWCSLADLGRYDATAIKDIIRVATDATRAARTDFARVVSVGDLTAVSTRSDELSTLLVRELRADSPCLGSRAPCHRENCGRRSAHHLVLRATRHRPG
jgi:hypothetical protein